MEKENLFIEYPYVNDLLPKYTAQIQIGNWYINLIDKTFTSEQIEHMREYFGWEVRNLGE